MDRQSNRFSWHPGIVGPDQEVSALITLVQSFSDTGLVQARVRDAILSQLPHHELGEFDIDLLLGTSAPASCCTKSPINLAKRSLYWKAQSRLSAGNRWCRL